MSLDEIRARAKAATDGPWVAEYSGEQGNCVLPSDAQSTREAVAVTRLYHAQADADFIAHARTDIPFLLNERDKLRAALDAALSVHVEATFQRLEPQQECKHCRYAWPCVTVRAITEALR